MIIEIKQSIIALKEDNRKSSSKDARLKSKD